VEAGVHFPSDVLAGVALGNFIAASVHDTFLGPAIDVAAVRLHGPDGFTFAVGWRF